MEAGLRSRKRKHQSSISDGIFTRSKSQVYVHRHRSGYARPDSVRASNPLLSLEGTTRALTKQEPWGFTTDHVTSAVAVKDLRARRVFSPTTITDKVLSSGNVDLKADMGFQKTYDGNPNPNMSSPEGDAGHGDLGVSSSVAIDPKPTSENRVDSFLVSGNNVMEADPESDAGRGNLGVSSSVAFDRKSSSEIIVDSSLVNENNVTEADQFVEMTPRVADSDQNKGAGEKNGIISATNEIIDTQCSMIKSQSSVTNPRSKKKVFISPKSFSYRRLLPYLTELGTNDSPNFEIVVATLPKVQKSSNMVPNKDQEVDTAPTNNKSGLSDAIQKNHEDACNETMEECLQMTPPDSDIYNKPNLDKTPEVLLKTTDADTVKNFSNENKDSISSSNLVLKSCSRMKMLQTPTSFSHRRLLPFLMSVSGDDSGVSKSNQLSKPENISDQNQQPPTPSLINQSIIVDESQSQTTADEKSDSPTSTLTPLETSFESTTAIAQVSNDNLVDTHEPDTKLTESTSHSEMKLQAEADSVMKLEQESPIKDLKLVEETTSNLEIVASVDTNDNQKAVNGSTHESLLQIAPLNTPLINRDISKNGILKRTPRGCRGICNCLNCTSFRLHAERSFEFSRNQMHDAEEVALELINDMNSLRNILERTGADSNEVKEVCEKSLYKEEVARARLAQMNEDLSFHCRSMTLLRPKVTFANKIEEKVISDKKMRKGER
ncbi:uncharacterized protein LOC111911438 [Lactuca sativa]|uniref:Uncharacterized protein n=1 Tax=Lactuca sativa TaxID=4236 RepID=A0A9R1V317_LACSA|nr:uncharacterized protein LOC111911438 [Lactuca sativa]KAJ0198815.1 hypothetical protein LSAT_V11C600321110 [Lactuca sativa]